MWNVILKKAKPKEMGSGYTVNSEMPIHVSRGSFLAYLCMQHLLLYPTSTLHCFLDSSWLCFSCGGFQPFHVAAQGAETVQVEKETCVSSWLPCLSLQML